jgi:predicted DNA-binding ribbon-helix-helix protein
LERGFPHFTAVVNCGAVLYFQRSKYIHVTPSAKRKRQPVLVESSSVRATISFPSDIYQTLENIARQKKVSLAWVVREAAEQYIANKWPLLAALKGE